MGTEQLLEKNEYIWNTVKEKFGFELTLGQIEIVRKIAFREHKRISVSAYTRYGKTICVALGISLIIKFNKNIRIAFIGPKQEQAGLLRQYMADLIMKDKDLLSMAQISVKGESKIQKEASKKRMTFTNGCEYRVFSAEGEADRLMGFGADVVVKDEACLINRIANAKIMRMLGDNPDESMLIELYNPWERDNVTFEHTLNPKFNVTRIDWRQGVKEGRTTKVFIDEQKKELTPLEFEILYESRFPVESEDSLYNLLRINEAEERKYTFEEELQELEKDLVKNKEQIKKFVRIISCDPADMGIDLMVILWGTKKENKYQLVGHYSEPKSDPMNIVGRIMNKASEFIKKVPGKINIDSIGIGVGPLSRLKERIDEKDLKNIQLNGCHFGQRALKKDHFINRKAENYFVNRDLFNEGFISIPEIQKLKSQLLSMKWELSSAEKKRIIDPEKSPDFADALVYFTWKGEMFKSTFTTLNITEEEEEAQW